MAKFLYQHWKDAILDEIIIKKSLTYTCSDILEAKFLIYHLTKHNLPFTVKNMGAGIKIITTETEICPCCKQKI